MSAFLTALASAGAKAGEAALSSAATGASSGLVGSIFGRSGFQRKKDQMQLNEQSMQINQQLAQEAYMKQKELISDERAYQEDLYNRLQSPEAMVKQLEAAGINPAQFLSGGSSAIQPMTSPTGAVSAPSAHSGSGGGISYQTPQFPGNPFAIAQLEESRARVDNINADTNVKGQQVPYYQALTALTNSDRVLSDLNSVGVGFTNDMKALNFDIASSLKSTKIAEGRASLDQMLARTQVFARQIQEMDDRHDLHGMRKQELKNQLDIQIASCALLWARESAAHKGIELTDSQIGLIYEQALKTASETDLNEQSLIINRPKERDAAYRGLGSTYYDDLSGPVGSSVKAVIRFFEKSNAESPSFSPVTVKVNSNVSRVRSNFKGK